MLAVGISMTQTIIWQQRNTIKITEIIHQDHSMQQNYNISIINYDQEPELF